MYISLVRYPTKAMVANLRSVGQKKTVYQSLIKYPIALLGGGSLLAFCWLGAVPNFLLLKGRL